RDRVLEELLRENRRLAVLNDLSTAVMEHLADDDLLIAILDRANTLVETRHGFIALADPSATGFEIRQSSGALTSAAGKLLSAVDAARLPEVFPECHAIAHVRLQSGE